MFAAAATKLDVPTIPGNWFDGVVLVILIIGIFRGRKRGMSEEILSLLQVLTIIVVCSLYYQRLGKFFAGLMPVTLVYANLFVYVGLLLLVVALFAVVKRAVGEKLVSSDLFGRMEYYLGMLAGATRYFCFVLIAMALLNAPQYTEAEIAAAIQAQQASLGSNFFPTYGQIQRTMLRDSLTGKIVRENLETVLIEPSSSAPLPAPKKEQLKDRKMGEWEKAYKGK